MRSIVKRLKKFGKNPYKIPVWIWFIIKAVANVLFSPIWALVGGLWLTVKGLQKVVRFYYKLKLSNG